MRTIALLFLPGALTIASAQAIPPDSLREYASPAVVVTATRSTILAADAPTALDVLTRTDITRSTGTTVGDVLRTAPGAFLKDYGPDAQLKTISLRGLSSEHVLVLLDGVRINDAQNGLVDFSLLPTDNIERIEIVRGGNSALYGEDAVGGVVNLVSRLPDPGLHARAEAAAGSYGYERYRAAVEVGTGTSGLIAGFMRDLGADNYPFFLHTPGMADTSLRRRNADFSRTLGYADVSALLGGRSDLRISIQRSAVDRGAPGTVMLPMDFSKARQGDHVTRIGGTLRNRSGDWLQLQLGFGYQAGTQTYIDPAWGMDSRADNTMTSINPQAIVSIASTDRLVVGGEYSVSTLTSGDFDGTIRRREGSVYLSNEYTWDRGGTILDKVLLYQSLRYDALTDVGSSMDRSAWSPKVGVNVRLIPQGDVRIRASYGSDFRAPTFNDLYYRGFSNPHLQPERSISFDAGVRSTVEAGGVHTIDVTWFSVSMKDRILFDLTQFIPVNIGRVESQGIEAQYEWRMMDDVLAIGGSFTATEALKTDRISPGDSTYRKQLPYVPTSNGTVHADVALGPFRAGISELLIGRRYSRPDNSAWLSPYALTDLSLSASIPAGALRVQVRVDVSNVFDRSYEVFNGYPMPGRTARLSLALQY